MYAFSATLAPTYLAATASALVGLFVLLRARRPVNLTLGGWLLVTGAGFVASAGARTAPTFAGYVAWTQVENLAEALADILAIWFVVHLVTASPTGRWIAAAATAYIGTLLVVNLIAPETFIVLAPPAEADPFYAIGFAGGIAAVKPAAAWGVATNLVFAALALAVARACNGAKRPARPALLLVFMLFLVQSLFRRLDEVVFLLRVWDESIAHTGWPAHTALFAVDVVALGVLGLALWTSSRDEPRTPWGRLGLAGATATLAIATGTFLDNDNPVLTFTLGLLGLVFPLGMAYAALRGQFPGLDHGARVTVRSGTVAAIFLAVGFIVSEAAAEFFGAQAGNEYWGIGAAGLLVFAISPMQRLADRVASATLPDASSHGPPDAAFAWEEMVRLAWADGRVSPAERLRLDMARERLGVDPTTAARIERAVLEDLAGA